MNILKVGNFLGLEEIGLLLQCWVGGTLNYSVGGGEGFFRGTFREVGVV